MRVFVSGATGFVGTQLCHRLRAGGHMVLAFVRNKDSARARLGPEPELLDCDVDDAALQEALSRCDAVVNLAGSPVARRWTTRARREIVDSRVDLSGRLSRAIARAERPPQVLVSTSAIGYFGDCADVLLDAQSSAGQDWLARLCVDWEAAARAELPTQTRCVILRVGLVLGRGGGVMAKLLPSFKLGLGACLGDGRQWMSWIHMDDLVSMFVRAIEDEQVHGVFCGVAPTPVRNAEFTQTLGKALGRPACLKAPRFALRLGLGEASSALVASQRVRPLRWHALGFEFAKRELGPALEDLLGGA